MKRRLRPAHRAAPGDDPGAGVFPGRPAASRGAARRGAGPVQAAGRGRSPARDGPNPAAGLARGHLAGRGDRADQGQRTRSSATSRGASRILVDPDGLREAGQTLESPVRRRRRTPPPGSRCRLGRQLRIILEPLGLAAEVKDGAIVITSRGRVEDARRRRGGVSSHERPIPSTSPPQPRRSRFLRPIRLSTFLLLVLVVALLDRACTRSASARRGSGTRSRSTGTIGPKGSSSPRSADRPDLCRRCAPRRGPQGIRTRTTEGPEAAQALDRHPDLRRPDRIAGGRA